MQHGRHLASSLDTITPPQGDTPEQELVVQMVQRGVLRKTVTKESEIRWTASFETVGWVPGGRAACRKRKMTSQTTMKRASTGVSSHQRPLLLLELLALISTKPHRARAHCNRIAMTITTTAH